MDLDIFDASKELDRRQQEMVNSWANLRSMNEINIYEENEYGDMTYKDLIYKIEKPL